MARSARPPESPTLFDLPLGSSDELDLALQPETPKRGGTRRVRDEAYPPADDPTREESPPLQAALGFDEGALGWEDEGLPADALSDPGSEEGAPTESLLKVRAARLGERWRSGLADLALHLAVGLVALAGADLLGARPDLEDLPAVGFFLLAFSLFYTIVPLAFWGATPGMAWTGLVCRASDGQMLSFGQAFRHWLGSLLTLALVGLPTLLGLGGRAAFSDRLAGTVTFREPS